MLVPSAFSQTGPPEVTAEPDLWKSIKAHLKAEEGERYFNTAVKDALLPTLTGRIVRVEPAGKPTTIVLAIEDGKTADATLKFASPLGGTMSPGAKVSFQGAATSYTLDPFMVVFQVEKEYLYGWSGRTSAAPAKKNKQK